MGQFEYSVALSSVKPEDIKQVAQDYLAKKRETENKMKLVPLEDRVVVRPLVAKETTTSSGLILQSLNEDKPSEGIVEAVGPGITFGNGSKLTIDLKPGDHVAFSKFAGTEVEDLLILPYKDIIAVFEENND